MMRGARTGEAQWGRTESSLLQVAVFVAAVAITIDGFLLMFEVAGGARLGSIYGRALGDGVRSGFWDVIKAAVSAGLLFVLASRMRSWALAGFSAIFMLVAVLDDATLHGPLGSFLGDRLELSRLSSLLPASGAQWGQLLVLTLAGLVALAAVWAVPLGRNGALRYPRRVLTVLLALLFLFAGVIDLIASGYARVPLQTVEEVGEHLVLSVTLGYVVALYFDTQQVGLDGSISSAPREHP